jgi:hypothetical protein
MILLSILLLTLIFLIVISVLTISAGGAIAIIIFGDVIVCIVFIVLIIKWLVKRRK